MRMILCIFAFFASAAPATSLASLRKVGSTRPILARVSAPDVHIEKELFIRDLSVVEDARAKGLGIWSFGNILQLLTPPTKSVAEFTREWFHEWTATEHLNGYPVTPRREARYLNLWPRDARASLDPARAPFRLLALVYRPDIHDESAPHGEFRLVFCGIRPDDRQGLPFLIIAEFRVPASARSWTARFHSLGSAAFGPELNARLARITETFVQRKNFLRLRTNDFIGGQNWEFRQFAFNERDRFASVPLDETPDLSFDAAPAAIVDLARTNGKEILDGTFQMPRWMTTGASIVPSDRFRWWENSRELPENLRHTLAKNTCNGCHGAETRTRFTHVAERSERAIAPVSTFLQEELHRRAEIVQKSLNVR